MRVFSFFGCIFFVLLAACSAGRDSIAPQGTPRDRAIDVARFKTIDISHDHGPVGNGVAVHSTDGDIQRLPGKPHFRIRTGSGGKSTVWLSGPGYALSYPPSALYSYAPITGGTESKSAKRFPRTSRAPRVFESCDPNSFDCGSDGPPDGGGWSWPMGCGDDGNQQCVNGCPDYTCVGPYMQPDGTPYCGVNPDGSCSDTILARWFDGMWTPGLQAPDGSPYMLSLVCTISLSTFDTLCAEMGWNDPRNWPPVVSLFIRYQTSPFSGQLFCNSWDRNAHVWAFGYSSALGPGRAFIKTGDLVPAGTNVVYNVSWPNYTVPNSSGIGAQYIPTVVQLQTANCTGGGHFPS
jgi:hypothetical protein